MKLLICTQAVDKNHPILGFFHGWIEEFAKHFTEVHVICLQKGELALPPNVFVYSLGKEAGVGRLRYLWRFYTYFWHIFFRVRVDYIFFHMGAIYNVLAAPFFFMRHYKNVRFYWWKAHGHINLMGRAALLFCDEVITSTASGFAVPTRKRRIVGQAINTARFQFQPQKQAKTVLFVGRVMPIKHLEVFIAVAKALEPAGYTFMVVGPSTDSAYQEKLHAQAARTNVQFLGPKTQIEIVALYQQASFFLNPSLTHSMDKTVLEAVLCGCIPLTANVAFRELLEPHGLFFQTQTAAAYVDRIRALSDTDLTPLRDELRRHVETAHSLDTFTQRIFNLS